MHTMNFVLYLSCLLLVVNLLVVWFYCVSRSSCTSANAIVRIDYPSVPIHTPIVNNTKSIPAHTSAEYIRLENLSKAILTNSTMFDRDIPTVPCLSSDGHLLVLSAGASRIRYGGSVTFIMVYPTDVKGVLGNSALAKPRSANRLRLWCIFDDGSVTAAYSYDSAKGYDRVSLLDCPVTSFASDTLWRFHGTLRVHLVSLTHRKGNVPILKAFISVPRPRSISGNVSRQTLTLCTSPLHNKAIYLSEWIEFHRLVGFEKFVVYNTTDTSHHLSSVIDAINRNHRNLVDVIQWNFSSLFLTDLLSTRYFQVEALHDCLIRYGDQSEWMGTFDLDEYIVPLPPYDTISDYLYRNVGRRIIGSINFWSLFFCSQRQNNSVSTEMAANRLIIERYTLRANSRYKSGREKYLYRPRFVQYLSIHHQLIGIPKEESSEKYISLAHYVSMERVRSMPGCDTKCVKDTSIRDRFGWKLKRVVSNLII